MPDRQFAFACNYKLRRVVVDVGMVTQQCPSGRLVSFQFSHHFPHGPGIGPVIPSITQLYSGAGSKESTRERHFFSATLVIIEEKKYFPRTLLGKLLLAHRCPEVGHRPEVGTEEEEGNGSWWPTQNEG